MTKTVFYKKKGRRYVPVREYDSQVFDAIPYDCSVIEVRTPNSTMRRYKIEPAMAPMVAASMILEDNLTDIISEASKYKLPESESKPTKRQAEAWEELQKAYGRKFTAVYGPSMRDVADSILKAISEEAQKLLTNESVKAQYEHFLLISTLSKDQENV